MLEKPPLPSSFESSQEPERFPSPEIFRAEETSLLENFRGRVGQAARALVLLTTLAIFQEGHRVQPVERAHTERVDEESNEKKVEPWSREEAFAKAPYNLFSEPERFVREPYALALLESLASERGAILFYEAGARTCASVPGGDAVLYKVIRENNDPYNILRFAPYYAAQEGADSLLVAAAERNPSDALYVFDSYRALPIAEKLLKIGLSKAPAETIIGSAHRYSNLPWTWEAIRSAAEKMFSKGTLFVEFLIRGSPNFKNVPGIHELITRAIEVLAAQSPRSLFYDASTIKDYPETPAALERAAARSGDAALGAAKDYRDFPNRATIIKLALPRALEEEPKTIIEFAQEISDIPEFESYLRRSIEPTLEKYAEVLITNRNAYQDFTDAEAIFERAVRKFASENPYRIFDFARDFLDKPYGEEVLQNAVTRTPREALARYGYFAGAPYAARLIEAAAVSDPSTALEEISFSPALRAVLEKSARPEIKKLLEIKNALTAYYEKVPKTNEADEISFEAYYSMSPSSYASIAKAGALFHDIVKGRLTVSEAMEVTQNDERFFKQLISIKADNHPLGEASVNSHLSQTSLRLIQQINAAHEQPDNIRFNAIEGMDARSLYTIMVYGEEEIFTSSFNGLFDRLLRKLHVERLSGDELLARVGHNKFRSFVKLAATYYRLPEFLKTMPSVARQQLLETFVADIETTDNPLQESVVIADAFATIEDPVILTALQKKIKSEYARVTKSNQKEGKALYGLLAGLFAEKAVINESWLRTMAERYRLPNVVEIPKEKLFNRDRTNVQQCFFYDDEDGIASYRSFINQYVTNPDWLVEDKKHYVKITSQNGERVEIFANKPKWANEGQEEIKQALSRRTIESIVVVHRGHSYHAQRTIAQIPPIAKIVYLGSCGGYSNITGVLERAPEAHLITTKGIGTMTINDPLLYMINNEIRAGKAINWPNFWQRAEQRWGRNEQFNRYVAPHQNLGVLFIKAYEQLKHKTP